MKIRFMIIKSSKLQKKKRGNMKITEYKINQEFSGAIIEIDGRHGKIKCTGEDRIYFILSGKGKFIIDGKSGTASKSDLIFIPKNTPYDISGKLRYFLISNPEFDPKHDVVLE